MLCDVCCLLVLCVACCALFAVRCSLLVACCLLCVGGRCCCVLLVGLWLLRGCVMLIVVCVLFVCCVFVVWRSLRVVRRLLCVACCMLFGDRCLLFVV